MNHQNINELTELLEKDQEIFSILKQCPYEILRKIRVAHYGGQEFVLDQGGIYNVFYIIVDGKVDIFVSSEYGKKYFLTSYGKGQYLGEMELFRQMPYISSVEAKDAVTLLEIDREVFLQWIKIDHHFSEYIIRTLCDSSYTMCKNMGENALYSLKQRICQVFIDNAYRSRELRIPVHTETMGEQLAVTQRSVNRIIKQLREKGIIEVDKRGVLIKDYQALLNERDDKAEK